MKDDTLIDFESPASTPNDALTELIRNGAKQLIQQAVEAELAEYMPHFADNK